LFNQLDSPDDGSRIGEWDTGRDDSYGYAIGHFVFRHKFFSERADVITAKMR
jgi:hypothetical protein